MPFPAHTYADFLGIDFEVLGVSAPIGSYFRNTLGGGAPSVQPNGMVTQYNNGGVGCEPTATGAMNSQLYIDSTNGFTLVIAGQTIDVSGDLEFWFQLDATTFNDLYFQCNPTQTILTATPNVNTINQGNPVQLACVFDPIGGTFSASVNGSPVSTTATTAVITDPTNPVQFFRSFATTTIKSWIAYFATYAPVPLTLLPSLSVYGVKPPKVIGGSSSITRMQANPSIIPYKYNNGLWR